MHHNLKNIKCILWASALLFALALLGACGDDDTEGSSTSTMSNGATSNGTTGDAPFLWPCEIGTEELGWRYSYNADTLNLTHSPTGSRVEVRYSDYTVTYLEARVVDDAGDVRTVEVTWDGAQDAGAPVDFAAWFRLPEPFPVIPTKLQPTAADIVEVVGDELLYGLSRDDALCDDCYRGGGGF